MSTSVQRADIFTIAAQLLVAIAGPEPVHIEMSARGPKKYYDVHRRFDERDARAHLQGDRTKGATLRYPDGKTRALCYDADTAEDWQCLQEAARILARSGYLPLLEASPIGRGGHVWIIFTDLVCAEIEALIGEPCGQCGCTLFYQSGPYRMCHLCYPRPAKFGRLTDKQWQRLLSIADVCGMLHLSRPKLHDLIVHEGLPTIKFGRAVRISPTSLQRWLANREDIA